MLQRVLCPVLVGRDEPLAALEDALLAANRGEGRFVVLGGEAGMGKTRLATELAQRARKLGGVVLWGSCSEAELSLPYLPFVEAIGNRLTHEDPQEVRARLGTMAAELAQLFPQLAAEARAATGGDPAQAKLRLFESVVGLLALWARDRGLLLVVDDLHWADASSRELLDHVARRLAGERALVLATYRRDEVDRRHPLLPALQAWRRTGRAELVSIEGLSEQAVAEMVATMLLEDAVEAELGALIHAHSDGNPFVVEELLKETIDRGDLFRTADGWDRRALEELRVPDTVRETVLLRLGRLEPAHVEVLRAGALLGRSFDHALLAQVAEVDEQTVDAALETAIGQQLLEEDGDAIGHYRWRHALTQEAISTDIVTPKRQRIHSRTADALAATAGPPLDLALHLLAAGRTDEAVDACLRAADDAERTVAFGEAAGVLERGLVHLTDPIESARLVCRAGRLRWANGEPAAAEQLLADGVRQLEGVGLPVEAARAAVYLGRSRWELGRPEDAREDFRRARDVLAAEPPSAELSVAEMRLATLYAFDLEFETALSGCERAIAIAEAVGAEFERLWALSFLATSTAGVGNDAEGLELADEVFEEALEKGFALVAWNTLYNTLWQRVRSMAGGLRRTLDEQSRVPPHPFGTVLAEMSTSWALLALGEIDAGYERARRSVDQHERVGATMFAWRSRLALAEALFELDRLDEAARELPPSVTRQRQDIVYEAPARLPILIAGGRLDEAVEYARRIAADDRVVAYPETVAHAVDAFLAAGLVDEAAELLARARTLRDEAPSAGLDVAEGQIAVAGGRAADARDLFARALPELERAELALWTWRTQVLLAESAYAEGDADEAQRLLEASAREANAAGAVRVREEAIAAARRLGIAVASFTDEPVTAPAEVLGGGERLVTSMFADVRGYTELTTSAAPAELADRLGTLYRWATAEVGRRHGIVDKFAGDAVMATFNAVGARVDHAVLALEAALALRDKSALMELPIGIGIAVGPAVVTRSGDANVSVLGPATNLAARLQTAAGAGEILLSDEAFRRVEAWLSERGLVAEPEALTLKGFESPQPAFRLGAAVASG